MKYFIANEKNEFEKDEFEYALYDACKVKILNNKTMILELLPFINKKQQIHSEIILQAIEVYYKKILQRIYNGEEVIIDNFKFSRKEDE